MTAELLVNVTPSETRVAYIDGGILQEIHIEREARRGIVGNIYKGRVSRVLPGMQAAFVDIGLDKAAFLHASDIMPHTECVAGEEQKQFTVRDISELVRQGQDLMVQVVKDPLGTKGARLTTDITLPSRYLVFMPGASHVGVSQRIESEAERERLKKVVAEYCDEQGGFIIRTAAEGVHEQEMAADAAYLKRVWTKVMERKKRNQTRYQLYGELALAQRVLRDFADAQLDRIRVDSRLTYEALLEFTAEYIPEMTSKLEHYSGRQPIFDLFDVENEIQRALERKVELKSGGYLIIDQTEAMTTIDINTGAFVGHRNLDDTIFNTNIEATQAIARQLRLRNLGGIIIIDFIDMNNEDHRRRVLHSLEQALSKDRVKTSINGFSQLGLVEMTRKRTRESVEHVLCNECPTCHGRGTVKSVETVCYEIMREIVRVHHAYDSDRFLVYASPAVAETLKGEESHALAEVEIFVGKQVKVQIEPLYNHCLLYTSDRLQVTRLLPFLGFWPEENLALQLSVESLIRPRFQRWLRDALMQCEKSQRQRIIFELAEADVCQYIGRLQPVMRLVNALGVRVAVVQAGLTLVGTSWIKQLDAELIKLHPGLARNIEKRSENQLLVQSLVEACKGMPMQVFATGVRSRSEWLVLSQCGVTGGQGEFFAASQPLDTNVKKYSQRYSV